MSRRSLGLLLVSLGFVIIGLLIAVSPYLVVYVNSVLRYVFFGKNIMTTEEVGAIVNSSSVLSFFPMFGLILCFVSAWIPALTVNRRRR